VQFGERFKAQGNHKESESRSLISNCGLRILGFSLCSMLNAPCSNPYAVYLVPSTLAAYAAKVAVDPTQLTAKVSPSS
jgi:hypothetical protein